MKKRNFIEKQRKYFYTEITGFEIAWVKGKAFL